MFILGRALINTTIALGVGIAVAACVISRPESDPTQPIASSTAEPAATRVPATRTLRPTATALPTATKTPRPAVNPVPEFPLTIGSTWVYSHTEYNEGVQNTDCCITLTVVANQMVGDYFVAEIEQNQSFSPHWAPFLEGSGIGRFWYAVSQMGDVFILPEMVPASQIGDGYLAYHFPLDAGGHWYQYAEDRKTDSGFNATFSDGPQGFKSPAGDLEDCFWVVTQYNSGGTQEWVCYGVGFVANEYDHQGTPFGYDTALLKYEIASP